MKYCIKCGTKMEDDVEFCPKCNTPAKLTHGHHSDEAEPYNVDTSNSYDAKIKFFMILKTILLGLALIPLFWCIPMTASISRRLEHHEKINVGFKICVLLFVSIVAGIMLFARKEETKNDDVAVK